MKRFGLPFLFVLLVLLSLTLLFHVPQSQATLIEDTKTFTSQTEDGHCYCYDLSYSAIHNAETGIAEDTLNNLIIGQKFDDFFSFYYIYRGFLFFDTSIIPNNANLTEVKIGLYLVANNNDTDFNITVQNGQPTYPHLPLETTDYYYIRYTGDGGSLDTSVLVAGYNNITLNSDGRNWVQKDGVTKLCLRSSRDINSNAPTGNEYVQFYTVEQGASYAPKLYVSYEVEGCKYYFYGPCNEDTGLKDGTIQVWVYPASATPYNFTLDGEHSITEEQQPLSFRFNLSEYNYSRYYVPISDYEEIYVFKPNDPYFYYNLDIIDLVGVSNAYLESYVNVNGSTFTVERRRFIAGNLIPYVLTWGKDYGFRITCDQGNYDFGHVTPTTEETLQFTITSLSFPSDYEVYEDITLSAERTDDTDIQILYEDEAERTNYVNVTIYRVVGVQQEWVQEYFTQQYVNTLDMTWSMAEANQNYIVTFDINHADYGELSWEFSCPRMAGGSNPFDFGFLGEWPIDSSQIISFAIIMTIFGLGSAKDSHIVLIAGIIVAMFLAYIGWFAVPWTILTLVFSLAILYALSRRRKETR